jgi:hypothetical protein
MTPDLATTLIRLVDDVIATARATPISVAQVEMHLPMDFVLRREGGTTTVAMAPPDAAALRGLSLAPGRLAFCMTLEGGAHVRD